MSALTVLETKPADVHPSDSPPDRDPGFCRRSLVRLAMDGGFPADWRLEHLLDRIEPVS